MALFVMVRTAIESGVPLALEASPKEATLEDFYNSQYARRIVDETTEDRKLLENWPDLAADHETWRVMSEADFIRSANTADRNQGYAFWEPGGYGCQDTQFLNLASPLYWAPLWPAAAVILRNQPALNHIRRDLDGWYGDSEPTALYDLFPGKISGQTFLELRQMRPGEEGNGWAD